MRPKLADSYCASPEQACFAWITARLHTRERLRAAGARGEGAWDRGLVRLVGSGGRCLSVPGFALFSLSRRVYRLLDRSLPSHTLSSLPSHGLRLASLPLPLCLRHFSTVLVIDSGIVLWSLRASRAVASWLDACESPFVTAEQSERRACEGKTGARSARAPRARDKSHAPSNSSLTSRGYHYSPDAYPLSASLTLHIMAPCGLRSRSLSLSHSLLVRA